MTCAHPIKKTVCHDSSAEIGENGTERRRKNNEGKGGNRNVLVRQPTVMGFQIPAHVKASDCAKYPTNNSTTARTNTIIVPEEPCRVHVKEACSHVTKTKGSATAHVSGVGRECRAEGIPKRLTRRTCPRAAQVCYARGRARVGARRPAGLAGLAVGALLVQGIEL
jgi:hypothetical protein